MQRENREPVAKRVDRRGGDRLYYTIQQSQLTIRRDGIVLTRLRLGHCGLASCLNIIGKHPDGLCQCGQQETVQHVLFSCDNYRIERQQLYEEPTTIRETFTVKITTLCYTG